MADDVTVDLVPDLDEKVRHLPEVKTASMEQARKVAQIARENAPRESGTYADGIVVQETKGGARVFASDQKSAWIEFGVPGRNQPARWILRRAAESAGLKFVKRGG